MSNNIEQIHLDIAEKTNVSNILISNFASQCLSVGSASTVELRDEHRIGLEIAAKQLGSFVSNLIAENGNTQLKNLEKP